MKKLRLISLLVAIAICSFKLASESSVYQNYYSQALNGFDTQLSTLCSEIKNADLTSENGKEHIRRQISIARLKMKGIDFWLRYFEPVAYNRVNGPLPVTWENEVFEKYEPPYKRDGAGLTLAELYLEEQAIVKDTLLHLVQASIDAINTFRADSIAGQLTTSDHFFLANRLYLLNLAAVYTTGFECPDKKNIIPELRAMLRDVKYIYSSYNNSFPSKTLTTDYLDLYDKTIAFVNSQPADFKAFNHFLFIRDYINPLFAINQKLIVGYGVRSINFNDYTLNNSISSIFNKGLYAPQNTKGIYSLVDDAAMLREIKETGKLLFYDPILSGNNERSCASCHKSAEYFTDTTAQTNLQFNRKDRLTRNTPSLINAGFNHLTMLDGKHITLQAQARDVTTNPIEMGGTEKEIVNKVLSCRDYRKSFKKFLKLTPEENEVTLNHIVSAITFYYNDFSAYYAPFDEAMNNNKPLSAESIRGFNLFMGKAQCGTCHYVPQFNGVKPPYIGSEFEVLGVPEDAGFKRPSPDKGRYLVNPAPETMSAFRTGTIRNAQYTKPYMHNGVFKTIEEVIDFYDAGGGVGRGLDVTNQTLSTDSLKLSPIEKNELISFIHSLNEDILFQTPPAQLPASAHKELNTRKVGGVY